MIFQKFLHTRDDLENNRLKDIRLINFCLLRSEPEKSSRAYLDVLGLELTNTIDYKRGGISLQAWWAGDLLVVCNTPVWEALHGDIGPISHCVMYDPDTRILIGYYLIAKGGIVLNGATHDTLRLSTSVILRLDRTP
jgi:hypothetical protein